jgi:hypothetical protein
MENKVTSHIVKGIILGIVSFFFTVILYVFNMYTSMLSLLLLELAVLIIGIIIAIIIYSNQNKNQIKFGNLFAHGFKMTAVMLIINIGFIILSHYLLFPDLADKITTFYKNLVLNQTNLSADIKISFSNQMNEYKEHFVTKQINGTIIIKGISGFIASLIGAAVSKKKSTNPFENPIV